MNILKIILGFVIRYKWIFTALSFTLALITFFIKEETRNFIWNAGWLIPFIISFIINIVLATYIIIKFRTISQTDIDAYNSAMSYFYYDNVDYWLEEYDMGGPIRWEEMKRYYDFRMHTSMSFFHINNRKLRLRMLSFRDSLSNFLNKLALYTSPMDNNPDFVKIPWELELEDPKIWEKEKDELNKLATLAHIEFTKLVKYAKKKEIDKTKPNI